MTNFQEISILATKMINVLKEKGFKKLYYSLI